MFFAIYDRYVGMGTTKQSALDGLVEIMRDAGEFAFVAEYPASIQFYKGDVLQGTKVELSLTVE